MRIILNPGARHGAGRRLRPTIERELQARRLSFELVETEGPGHAIELARQAAEAGVGRIVAAGGDGTVHEVVNGIMAGGAPAVSMGMIPIGTGNDFVKMFPGTSTRTAAFAALSSGCSVPVDVGVARWDGRTEYFINAMGTGIDVEVVRQMRRSRLLPGGVIYVAALLRALARYRAMTVEITVDGHTTRQRIMNLAVCNGPSIGGSFRICPRAVPFDGALDICLIEEMPIWRNARLVPRVLNGTHAGQPGVTILQGTGVRLRLPHGGPLLFQVDGELREVEDGAHGVEVSLIPAHLNVIAGATAGAAAQKG
jgi:diacylglycerol kinase (ATP)